MKLSQILGIGTLGLAVLAGCSSKCPGLQPKLETISVVPANCQESTANSYGYISAVVYQNKEPILARSKNYADDYTLSEIGALIDFKAREKGQIELTGYNEDGKFLFKTLNVQVGKETFTYKFE